ncbi:MAG: diaminopimelate epimerase [Oceanococcaceae bacterium]
MDAATSCPPVPGATLPFVKMQALGNDFVVLDGHKPLPDLTPDLLRRLADRRHGIGCDQILVVDPAPSVDADVGYRIFNADGSTVGQCGNGVRCVAVFAARQGIASQARLRVQTQSTRMIVERLPDGQVRVEMAVPDFRPQALPLQRDVAPEYDIDGTTVRAVSMGNPHLVLEVPRVDEAPVATLGPVLATHPVVPHGANVGFAEVLSPTALRLRVYERGAGETPACGSGACGAVAALVQAGRLQAGAAVTVHLPGGTLQIEWAGGDQPLFMTGPACWVYQGQYSL